LRLLGTAHVGHLITLHALTAIADRGFFNSLLVVLNRRRLKSGGFGDIYLFDCVIVCSILRVVGRTLMRSSSSRRS
ncbi:MAG: hypothetical protein ABTQ32_06245, partial [Myxococcaceae bacterium]